jgi:hypothetical protein
MARIAPAPTPKTQMVAANASSPTGLGPDNGSSAATGSAAAAAGPDGAMSGAASTGAPDESETRSPLSGRPVGPAGIVVAAGAAVVVPGLVLVLVRVVVPFLGMACVVVRTADGRCGFVVVLCGGRGLDGVVAAVVGTTVVGVTAGGAELGSMVGSGTGVDGFAEAPGVTVTITGVDSPPITQFGVSVTATGPRRNSTRDDDLSAIAPFDTPSSRNSAS